MTPPTESYCTIVLTRSQVTLVSPIDFPTVSQFKWYALWNPKRKCYYAVRRDKYTREFIYMHRFLLGLGRGDRRKGDHIVPANTLDNRRSNIRIGTNAQNGQNRGKQINNKSGYKGVSWHKAAQKWLAQIMVNNKYHYLGLYDTAEEAYVSYCKAAVRYHGEFARVA